MTVLVRISETKRWCRQIYSFLFYQNRSVLLPITISQKLKMKKFAANDYNNKLVIAGSAHQANDMVFICKY